MSTATALNVNDFGLLNSQILETAMQLAPELFSALRIAETLDPTHFPLTSDATIEHALRAVANDGAEFSLAGMKITSRGAKDYFPQEFLPVVDKMDLLRKVYMAILISHRETARRRWDAIQSGKSHLSASHPLPKEAF